LWGIWSFLLQEDRDNPIVVLEGAMLGVIVWNINHNRFPAIVAALVGKSMIGHILATIV
jgi:hypothetical protein